MARKSRKGALAQAQAAPSGMKVWRAALYASNFIEFLIEGNAFCKIL